MAAPQPQYSLILPLGCSVGSSIVSSPRSVGTGLAWGSTLSCSVGASLLPGGHGLQRLGEARVAAGAQRDVDVAAAAARARQAELVALLLAAEQCRHRRVAAAAAHHHAGHAAHAAGRRERRDVDPALGNRRLVGRADRRRLLGPRGRRNRGRQEGAGHQETLHAGRGVLHGGVLQTNVRLALRLSLARCLAGGTCRKLIRQT